ncbi:hypothetical protein A3B26_03310 [Candidatus Giovannonibacteria bacterium RIFCSPLOWO2_01_FULL_48_47]|nr:MAG: hypothetical protein A3B26_03310 [Candidatus Giovannonibacteria bacterium RIFCSPLOWO2_01_FULL_48_47]OGF95278.1 MAG: hypothetical protein A2433_00925 [Candidatus Giovannonibacteria bacterium RIFOXYC1_FULL_48_8]OGF95790.1 MAG: hypothetical protein A2613_04000 [Candidatus Giovannonibacteria bacterium RIFOXYD1_FULL_48_21]HBT81424.1 hypothetical protein [Candidatus Giovannonibacteria bacterium]
MNKIIISGLAFALLFVGGSLVFAVTNPLEGKVIALDAGHGNGETGAVNKKYGATEADVNWDVVVALESKLTAQGAKVVIAERLSTRRDRVADAVDKCQTLYGRKCDALVSIHHNGNDDPGHDGTLVIYNEKQDIPLAQKLHDALLPLTGIDEGYLHGGYGMTVYKNLVSVITEAYYITNDEKAARYLNDLNADGISNLVIEEADAQVAGLADYFASQSSGGKGRNK